VGASVPFNRANQSITLPVVAPLVGTYNLALRLATGSGNARFRVLVDGTDRGTFTATRTGSTGRPTTQIRKLLLSLSEGKHDVQLIFQGTGTSPLWLQYVYWLPIAIQSGL
jgi:hypothetical protein